MMAFPSVSHLEYHLVLPMVLHSVHSMASMMAYPTELSLALRVVFPWAVHVACCSGPLMVIHLVDLMVHLMVRAMALHLAPTMA